MAFPSPSFNPYDTLRSEIDSYIKYSRVWMRVWALIYYGLRTSLITLSACVAAKQSLSFGDQTIALFSLIVAIGTSLDTWLKTGNRYRGHYMFNDKFIALCTDLELTDHADTAQTASIQTNFKKMVEEYAQEVLPS